MVTSPLLAPRETLDREMLQNSSLRDIRCIKRSFATGVFVTLLCSLTCPHLSHHGSTGPKLYLLEHLLRLHTLTLTLTLNLAAACSSKILGTLPTSARRKHSRAESFVCVCVCACVREGTNVRAFFSPRV
jgi:hypothetical protein